MKYKSHSQSAREIKPNTPQLSKILIYLEEGNRSINQSQIVRDTLIPLNYVRSALHWLKTYGLIKVLKIRGVRFYSRSEK